MIKSGSSHNPNCNIGRKTRGCRVYYTFRYHDVKFLFYLSIHNYIFLFFLLFFIISGPFFEGYWTLLLLDTQNTFMICQCSKWQTLFSEKCHCASSVLMIAFCVYSSSLFKMSFQCNPWLVIFKIFQMQFIKSKSYSVHEGFIEKSI